MNKLLEIEPVKCSSNLRGLRKLLNESEVSIRNLNSMGIASGNYGQLLIPILVKQLPYELVIEFHRKKDSKKVGDVDELIDFIKFEIEKREAANLISGITINTHETSRGKGHYQASRNKNNLPTSTALNAIVKSTCIFCNSNSHTVIKCRSFTNEQKRYKLKKEGRCYRCITGKHLISQCKVKIQPCEICSSFQHNSLFCPKTRNKHASQIKTPEKTEVDANPDNETVVSSVLKSQNSSRGYTTLLQTSAVQVESNSKKLIARILFDSGSQKPFIRKDLADALNLRS